MCRVIDSSGSVWQWVCNALIIPGGNRGGVGFNGEPHCLKGDCVGVFFMNDTQKGCDFTNSIATVAEQEF